MKLHQPLLMFRQGYWPFWLNWANSEGKQCNMAILKKSLSQSKPYYDRRERNDFIWSICKPCCACWCTRMPLKYSVLMHLVLHCNRFLKFIVLLSLQTWSFKKRLQKSSVTALAPLYCLETMGLLLKMTTAALQERRMDEKSAQKI